MSQNNCSSAVQKYAKGGDKVRYEVVKQRLYSADLGVYDTYGIIALEHNGAEWRECAFVSDVSVDPALAKRIAYDCTRYKLSPIHLFDVVCDYLEE